MAANAKTRSPKQTLIALVAITVLLFGGILAAHVFSTAQLTPKLGLDLEGGTQMVLEPVLDDPNAQVSQDQLTQARDIIAQRVDAYGVAEAEVTTQGGRNIVVSIPGQPDAATLDAIRKPSQLRFRAVLAAAAGSPAPTSTATGGTATGTATSKPTASATPTPKTPAPVFTTDVPTTAATSAGAAIPQALVQAETTQPTTPPTKAGGTSTATPSLNSTPTVKPTNASDPNWITPALGQQFTDLDCSKPQAVSGAVDNPGVPLVTCSDDGTAKYILGPVEVDGTDIADASAGYQVGANGQPTSVVEVQLKFTPDGAKKFGDVTTRLVGLTGVRNQFAIVLDKEVISAPTTQAAITNGQASITGNFTIESARNLAQQLKFGALPMSFTLQTQEDISPTLGSEQLTWGLIAGLIGLLLVVAYSLVQYRMLGLVTVASLVVAGILTYGVLTFLGWAYNFRLTMAGVTGVIVAIGVTADSFIVYFERIRDEVRDGRPLVAAVEAGWARARRTILAADAVNFLAAGVLYFLAASNVRGFAFTLGVTTLIDLAVVMLFTHPTVAILAHTKFFGGGHPWSGLSPDRLGAKARYVGMGRFVGPGEPSRPRGPREKPQKEKPPAPTTAPGTGREKTPTGAATASSQPAAKPTEGKA